MTMLKLFLASAMMLCASLCIADQITLAGNTSPVHPDSHAPIGVMGDHLHKKGEWMVSYRYMRMDMEDNIQGDKSISPTAIATQITNPNAPPPTVRVVPLEMMSDMHMLGLMYAPTDKLTLMAMLNYVEKSMDHLSYMGMMGTTELGRFTTESKGVGDTQLTALWGLVNTGTHKLHLNLGLSLPTGSIDETDSVLSSMNTQPVLRLPYAMQLGSGTFDLQPGLTYRGNAGDFGWGAQYMATLRLGDNDEGYTLGDKHQLSGWSSYQLIDWASVSLRLSYLDEDRIDDADPSITAPVTTANPHNYGGERLDVAVGVNLVGQVGAIGGHRLALEYQKTLDQDANGVQMEMQPMLTVGYQYAF